MSEWFVFSFISCVLCCCWRWRRFTLGKVKLWNTVFMSRTQYEVISVIKQWNIYSILSVCFMNKTHCFVFNITLRSSQSTAKSSLVIAPQPFWKDLLTQDTQVISNKFSCGSIHRVTFSSSRSKHGASFQDLPSAWCCVTPVFIQLQRRQTMTILQGSMVAWS